MYAAILDAFQPSPNGYPTKLKMYIAMIAAIGKRNTSVFERNGRAVFHKVCDIQTDEIIVVTYIQHKLCTSFLLPLYPK